MTTKKTVLERYDERIERSKRFNKLLIRGLIIFGVVSTPIIFFVTRYWR